MTRFRFDSATGRFRPERRPVSWRRGAGDGAPPDGEPPWRDRLAAAGQGARAWWARSAGRLRETRLGRAAVVAAAVLFALSIVGGFYLATLTRDLPSIDELDNPHFRLATVAYAAGGEELARFAAENRIWTPYEQLPSHLVQALIATEDRHFYSHGGIDYFRTASAATRTLLGRFGIGDRRVQGGSTITQQLARNLYNEKIGFERSVSRKLREMMTAVQIERRYEKDKIIEMYLNTVPFSYNAYGIGAAAQTFFGVDAAMLSLQQSAALVGMLQATTRYNPVRNPEAARERRNVVLANMLELGYVSEADYRTERETPIGASFHSVAITAGPAPHFAQVLEDWLERWGAERGINVLADGLKVHTTIDLATQRLAQEAVEREMQGLQAVVDVEWSAASPPSYTAVEPYQTVAGHRPFAWFWASNPALLEEYIRATGRFRRLTAGGRPAAEAVAALREDTAFMDSLTAVKARLEAGLVAIDPRTGFVRAWVGGRNMEEDWNDHVAGTRRQPGSTFKPFVYATAIDNRYSPEYTLPDAPFVYRGPYTHRPWSPQNFGSASGAQISLRDALATSNNLITARVITQLVTPSQVAFYARRMGIESPLEPVASLGLGTSDVTLLEITAGYCTLASGGKYRAPTFVTRIENREGTVLYLNGPATPQDALSRETAFTVVDMMRGVIDRGTGTRIRWQYGLGGYDLAGKTGTTQNAADGWFILMHPHLVTGAWVGFNDRRIAFRSNFWGQGAHNALFVVGSFFRDAARAGVVSRERFPSPGEYGWEE